MTLALFCLLVFVWELEVLILLFPLDTLMQSRIRGMSLLWTKLHQPWHSWRTTVDSKLTPKFLEVYIFIKPISLSVEVFKSHHTGKSLMKINFFLGLLYYSTPISNFHCFSILVLHTSLIEKCCSRDCHYTKVRMWGTNIL